MKTFEDYIEQFGGVCYKDDEAFLKQNGEICYIPENAENLSNCFDYSDLKDEVVNWKKDNEDYFTEHETTVDAVLTNMFENLSWEFPSTFLDQLNY